MQRSCRDNDGQPRGRWRTPRRTLKTQLQRADSDGRAGHSGEAHRATSAVSDSSKGRATAWCTSDPSAAVSRALVADRREVPLKQPHAALRCRERSGGGSTRQACGPDCEFALFAGVSPGDLEQGLRQLRHGDSELQNRISACSGGVHRVRASRSARDPRLIECPSHRSLSSSGELRELPQRPARPVLLGNEREKDAALLKRRLDDVAVSKLRQRLQHRASRVGHGGRLGPGVEPGNA